MSTPALDIRIYEEPEAMARAVAIAITGLWRQTAANNNLPFYLALSGGRTPLTLFKLLGEQPALLPDGCWKSLQLFWADERLVPFDHPENNAGAAWRAGLKNCPLSKDQIHPIPTDRDASAAAAAYDATLNLLLQKHNKTALDLVLLGIGEDGHTASLFPQTIPQAALVQPSLSPQGIKARISLTAAFLKRTSHVYFLATGAAKRPLIKHLRTTTGQDAAYPFEQIHGRAKTIYWLDREAGG